MGSDKMTPIHDALLEIREKATPFRLHKSAELYADCKGRRGTGRGALYTAYLAGAYVTDPQRTLRLVLRAFVRVWRDFQFPVLKGTHQRMQLRDRA